jgi:hypothetical protein
VMMSLGGRSSIRRLLVGSSASGPTGARGGLAPLSSSSGKKTVTVHWLYKKTGEIQTVDARIGENVMRMAQRHEIPLEGKEAAGMQQHS